MLDFINQDAENMPGIVFVKDTKSRFLFSSAELAKQAGVNSPSKLVELTDFDTPWAEFAEQFQIDDARVFQGETIQKFDPFINHHGEHGFLLVTKQPVVRKNEIIGVIGNAQLVSSTIQSSLLALQYQDKKLTNIKSKYEIKSNYPELTKRESEILYHLIRYYSAKLVGQKLNISPRTVEKHIEFIKEKFNVKSKNQLIEYAINNNLFNVIITK
jgi:DNA-binding CsgD family transcriptional regulator